MTAIKIFLYLILGVLTLAIAAAVIAPFALDLNNYRGYIAGLVKEQTGLDLAIDGSIDLSVLPIPTVKVSGVRIANLQGASSPDIVRIAAVEARIALMPLFRGQVEIDSLTFVDPVIELEILADGSANWQLALGDANNAGTAAVRIDSLKVENATLTYRDGVSGNIARVEKLYLEAAMGSIEGPFNAAGRLVAQSGDTKALPLDFEVEIGRLDSRPLPLRATIKLASADAAVTFFGSASSASADAEISGKLKIEGASLARILMAVGGGPPHALLDQPFSATANLVATAAAAGINDMRFDFAGIQGTGAVSATLAQGPQVDVAIAFNRIDLDALMAKAGDSSVNPADSAPFALPGGIYATLDLRVEALVFKKSVVRQVLIVAALDQGIMTLQQASALLPGGSDVAVFGVLDSLDGKPHFTGQIEASADNLRAVLDWLEIAYPEVPADRLRTLSLSSKIEVTPNLAKVSAIDLRLDLSRLSGGINVGIGARPAFNAIVSIDKINLDAYLPGESEEAKGDGNPLALLNDFDAEIKAKVGLLTYMAAPVSGIALDAGLRSGVLTVRSLVIGDLAGAGGIIAGTLDSAKPAFDLTYDLEAGDATRLFQLAKVAPPSPDIGAVALHGRVTGDFAAVTLDSRLTLPNAEARLKGALTGLRGTPLINAEISLETESLSGLAQRLGITLSAKADKPFSLKGKVKGDVESATVDLTVATIGADMRMDGSLYDLLDAPRYDLDLAISHPDFVALIESLADGVRFDQRDLGEVRLRAKVSGDAESARIEGIDALLGPSQIAGVIAARFDGPRPSFEADLTAGEFVADMFLAAVAKRGATSGGDATASANNGGGGAPRWSRDPIDLAAMRAFDLKARIVSKALAFRKYLFEDVTLRLALTDGVLDVEELSGRLYGGSTNVRVRLTATAPPTLEVSLVLQGADMRALMIDAAGIDTVSGLFDLTGRFNSRGRSEFELVSALQGEAKLAMRDGSIEGIDLGQLNSRLADINSEADLIALIGGALNGGTTAIQSLDGSLIANGGVLRSDNLRAVLEGGEGRATASIDLPNWQLALNSEFRLSGHPKAPPVGLLLMGPIDNPEREIRDRALREFITAKIIAAGVRKLIPAITGGDAVGGTLGGLLDGITGGNAEGAAANQNTAPAEETQAPEPAPKKLFENLLEGLIQGVGN